MRNQEIIKEVIQAYTSDIRLDKVEKPLYPIGVSRYFPYPSKYKLYKEFAIENSTNIEDFYKQIQNVYNFNCQYVLNNDFFDIFVDMEKVYGLGDISCEELIKESLKLFSPYSDKAKELLKKLEELE